MKPLERNYKRIVIKIGSSLFYSEKEDNAVFLNNIVKQITSLISSGKEVVIVSSGAIAFGMHVLGLVSRPKDLPHLQAAAATGQNLLMESYSNTFKEKRIHCAQILLTWDDFNSRKRYLNAKSTLLALLKLRNVVPIINENDTVSTDEIKFGDNDRLSALVSNLISADILIILSDVDGLLDKAKNVIRVVDEITPQIKDLAYPAQKKTAVGGMITKIEAAKIVVDSGIPCVIANGRDKDIILSVIKEPGKNGTLFIPKSGLSERERWLAFGTKPKGKIKVDEGAKNALKNNKSLLCVGIVGVEGNFECGDIVSVVTPTNLQIGIGKVGISSKVLSDVKGSRYDKEVIHRDNIVIL